VRLLPFTSVRAKGQIGYLQLRKIAPKRFDPALNRLVIDLGSDSETYVLKIIVLPVLCAVALSACLAPAPPEGGGSGPKTTGQALAQMACPHRIAEASAWVNHMPGTSRAPRELQVDVRLAEATDTAIVLRSDASTGDTLILEIRTAPNAPVPGRLAYREPVPNPMYRKISFFCRGGEIHDVDSIERVY
jgi:hypothetical protein